MSADPPVYPAAHTNDWLATVLLAGLVAVVLNLVLPQEDELVEEDCDAERILDNAETGSIPKKERSDV